MEETRRSGAVGQVTAAIPGMWLLGLVMYYTVYNKGYSFHVFLGKCMVGVELLLHDLDIEMITRSRFTQ